VGVTDMQDPVVTVLTTDTYMCQLIGTCIGLFVVVSMVIDELESIITLRGA